jgi:hypothetical protein
LGSLLEIAKRRIKMNKIKTTFAAALFAAVSGCSSTMAEPFIVRSGKPASIIVASPAPEKFVQNAIDELQYHLERASGTKLQVVSPQEAAQFPKETVRIIMSDKAAGKETYRVQSNENTLTFTGDGGKSDALQWAVDYYLDTQLGVRWLWPGEVGTFVPRQSTIELKPIDHQGRPALEARSFRTAIASRRSYKGSPELLSEDEYRQVVQDAQKWLTRFQNGSRSSYGFGHAFTKWWDKYGADHPEYFAVPPEGSDYKQPWPAPERVKLRIGNPAVAEAIIAEWKAAGSPDNWNVSPNDSRGFDTSAESRALDDPPNQDPKIIWSSAEANLTARYIKFWNGLITEMRKTNPRVTLSSYAYSNYYTPPVNLKVEPGIILGIVPSFSAQEDWLKWSDAGAKLVLRPNWWHVGAMAPVIPLHNQGNFIKFAQNNGMISFDSDSLMGYWATQGPLYYTVARLIARPDLNVDQVIDEYTSAFGKAAPDIKEYLKFWEDFTNAAAYPAALTTIEYHPDAPKDGAVRKLADQEKVSPAYLRNGWQVLPYIYTDDVLGKGYAILDRADKNAASDNDYVKQRIQFLRDGLDHLRLTRDVLELGFNTKRTPEQEKQYVKLAAQLQKTRHTITPRHVYWGEVGYQAETRRLAPTYSDKTIKEAGEMEKMLAEE